MNVKSSVEEKDAVTKLLSVTIPAGDISKEIESQLKSVAKTAKIKGFRAGKAPKHMIEQIHGRRIRNQVAHELISSTLADLIKEHDIHYVGSPELDIGPIEEGKDIHYTASLAIYPEPEIKGYKKTKVSVPKEGIEDSKVDEVLERLRESRAEFKPVELRSTAEKGDAVELSVILKGDDDQPPQKVRAVLGIGELPAEFDEKIPGMNAGEEQEIVVSGHVEEGKPAAPDMVYHVVLEGITEKILPPLDDEFAHTLDENAKTLLELRLGIRDMLEKEAEAKARGLAEGEILSKLVEDNPFPVPQVLVDQEIWNMLVRSRLVDPDKIDRKTFSLEPFREQAGTAALERVRGYIILDSIAKIESIKPEEEEIQAYISELAVDYGLSDDEIRSFLSSREKIAQVVLDVSRRKVMDFLFEHAEVTYTFEAEGEKDETYKVSTGAKGYKVTGKTAKKKSKKREKKKEVDRKESGEP